MLSLSIAVIDKVEIGLDQKLSMPQVYHFHSFAVMSYLSFIDLEVDCVCVLVHVCVCVREIVQW